MEDILITKLKTAIDECSLHIKRADFALGKIKQYFPLSNDVYNNLEEITISFLDQFVYRYTKLQDKIGSSLIKNICILLEGDGLRAFIDNLNILEKYAILDNVSIWNNVRDIRNNMTHEYPKDVSSQINILNDVYDNYKIIVKIFNNINSKFDEIVNK